MAPSAAEKSKLKKENADRQKRILASKEKILEIKRNILSIVEGMIEKEVSKEWFLKHCVKLCHADYDDVVQERAIEHLCGYALCSNTITQTIKQTYHISRVANKVYDLTERKNFCGNLCYKASQYLKAQLSPIPLYMRKEEHIEIHLLSERDNRGSVGEEIVFHHTIPKEEIEKVCTVEVSNHYINMLNEEVKNCADSLSELKIKEHVFEKQFVFDNQTAQQKEDIKEKESNENSEVDSDDSEDSKLFQDYENVSALSDEHMPVPKKVTKSHKVTQSPRKLQLISPLKPHTTNSPMQQLSLDFVFHVFKDWMTEDTMKYLLGEKYVYGLKADHLFEKMTTTDPIAPDKLSSIKSEYINLCLKIDNLPDDDLSDSTEIDFLGGITDSKSGVSMEASSDISAKKSFKKRPKISAKRKGKKVTFASDSNVTKSGASVEIPNHSNISTDNTRAESCVERSSNLSENTAVEKKNVSSIGTVAGGKTTSTSDNSSRQKASNFSVAVDNTEETSEKPVPINTPYEGGFPLVDSTSQNALRRQVLTNKLKAVYNDFLPIIGLHYTEIRREVKKFVDSLSLTPTNITFKPKEWKLISLILLRILTRTVLKDIHEEDQFLKLCEDTIIPTKVNVAEIEKLVCDILSPENILTLPIIMH